LNLRVGPATCKNTHIETVTHAQRKFSAYTVHIQTIIQKWEWIYKVINNTIMCDALNLLNATNKQLLVVYSQRNKYFYCKGFRATQPIQRYKVIH